MKVWKAWEGVWRCECGVNKLSHTVDGDGNGLGDSEAILALKGRDLAQGADLAVVRAGIERRGGLCLCLDQLQVQVVVLGSDQDGDGARVVLEGVSAWLKLEV